MKCQTNFLTYERTGYRWTISAEWSIIP